MKRYMSPTKSSITKRVSDLEACVLDVVKEELVGQSSRTPAQYSSMGFRRFSHKPATLSRFGSRASLGREEQQPEAKKKSKLKKFLTSNN